MASVEKMAQINGDSEMEEGEIVDELDDLSDVSSEEEYFLLRQRLEVLEDFNNVLGRTKKKRTSGSKQMRDLLYDLSEISATDINVKQSSHNHVSKHVKHHSKPSHNIPNKKIEEVYVKDNKRKKEHRTKTNSKRKPIKKISESSEESEDEYRNKRKKLADAVVGQRGKTDTGSLSTRLKKMLNKSDSSPLENFAVDYQNEKHQYNNLKENCKLHIFDTVDEVDCGDLKKLAPEVTVVEKTNEPIDILSSADDDVELITSENKLSVEPDSKVTNMKLPSDNDSDEDLALLRQKVLSTKALKTKPLDIETKPPSDDEDSDTTELRLICLKSTLLKRAIEMKQKQKLQKKRSQSTLEDDILFCESLFSPPKMDSGNNTDTESVDMDMGSEDEKPKDDKSDKDTRQKKTEVDDRLNANNATSAIPSATNKDDELDEDEDLLRAKLLTSLTKNLPNLVSSEILNNLNSKENQNSNIRSTAKAKPAKVPENKRFIIKLGDSDSEGEHEATKNLTKMHMKLSEPSEFQLKLDLLLKTTRKQVENSKLPDVVQKPATPKKPEKFIAKAVNHLPKSEQLEYKNLVKRMAELEKLKQLRQASIGLATQPLQDAMNPSNIRTDIDLEEKISLSRKKIADESAQMLKLKEEATKLSHKYKIVTTELHNLSTAIALNKKQQKAAHISLTKIRQQHQLLIKSSSTSLHSKVNGSYSNYTKNAVTTKVQKENNPTDYKNPVTQKTVKISVPNDLQHETNTTAQGLPALVNNKENRVVEITQEPRQELPEPVNKEIEITVEKGDSLQVEITNEYCQEKYKADDYKSPLDAFGDEASWNSDPNAILCPFDVGGQCKDPDCKYLHTNT